MSFHTYTPKPESRNHTLAEWGLHPVPKVYDKAARHLAECARHGEGAPVWQLETLGVVDVEDLYRVLVERGYPIVREEIDRTTVFRLEV